MRCLQALNEVGERGLCKLDKEIEVFFGDPIVNPLSKKAALDPPSIQTEATFCLYFLINLAVLGRYEEPSAPGGDATSPPPFFRNNEAIANAVDSMALGEIIAQYSAGNLASICSVNIISLIGFLDYLAMILPFRSDYRSDFRAGVGKSAGGENALGCHWL